MPAVGRRKDCLEQLSLLNFFTLTAELPGTVGGVEGCSWFFLSLPVAAEGPTGSAVTFLLPAPVAVTTSSMLRVNTCRQIFIWLHLALNMIWSLHLHQILIAQNVSMLKPASLSMCVHSTNEMPSRTPS